MLSVFYQPPPPLAHFLPSAVSLSASLFLFCLLSLSFLPLTPLCLFSTIIPKPPPQHHHLSTTTSAPAAAAAAVLSAVAFCLLIIFLQSSAVYSFSVPVIEAVFESKRCCSVLHCRPALPALAESLRLLSQIHMRRLFSDRFKMCVV